MKHGGGAQLDFTSLMTAPPAVFNCPAHVPFLETLAAAVFDGSLLNAGPPQPHDLPALTIYLPARATVEPLKLAFLSAAPDGATFLPRIRVLGEADPLDLFAGFGTRMVSTAEALHLLEQALAVPEAFDDLERRLHLSAFVLKASQALRSTRLAAGERLFADVPAVSAYTIAADIVALIDEAHSAGADLSLIGKLDSSGASGNEHLSLQVLRGVWKNWQSHKSKRGRLDREERQNRLMAIEAEFIRKSEAPVIIAGSTGSVAATVTLMGALASRPNSAIVLHGLDGDLDAESWRAVGGHPEHPQHGLHHLLRHLNIQRGEVVALNPSLLKSVTLEKTEPALRRLKFLNEALRPASSTHQWASFIETLRATGGSPAPGLAVVEAETIQEEAATIALILRECLETEGRTAALVTPDEKLMNRVRHALARWDLAVAGPSELLDEDRLAARVAVCAASGKPEDFVALLRLAPGEKGAAMRRFAEVADLGVLRQMWRPAVFSGIPDALSRAEHAISAGEARHPAMKRIAPAEWEAARASAQAVVGALASLTSEAGRQLTLAEWIARHQHVLAQLAELGLTRSSGKDGENPIFHDLSQVSVPPLSLDLANYAGLSAEIVATKTSKRLESPHPRIFLWSPLDARLLTADVIVLGGLNEGCWPHVPPPSPWLNRRDRAFVGLPPQERRIGLSAHDFAGLAAVANSVILTRSRKVNGSLTRPSRWVSRIQALAAGAGQLKSLEPEKPWLAWVRSHRTPDAVRPILPPEPKPPVSARPRRMSVTAIETWLANPYAIYARHILGLEPLRGLDEESDARDKGILYHAALHNYFQAYRGAVPEGAAEKLLGELDRAAADLDFNLENVPFWRPRFERFAAWFAGTDVGLRTSLRELKSEVGGKLKIDAPAGPFEITARADRIDLLSDGSAAIYDFKTSANTAKTSASRGAPQLALEGLLAREGAFAGIPAGVAADLSYIVATGGEPPGEIVTLKVPCAEAIQVAYTGTLQRIVRFDDEATPYAYEARAIYRDKTENDPYAHLARVKEWSLAAVEIEAGDD